MPIVAVRAGPTSLWTPPGGDAPRMEQEDWSKLDAHAKLAVYRHQYQISKDAAGEMARFRAEAQQKNAQITMLRAQVDSLHTQIAHSNENTPRQTRRNGEAASIPRSPAMGTCAGLVGLKVEHLRGEERNNNFRRRLELSGPNC